MRDSEGAAGLVGFGPGCGAVMPDSGELAGRCSAVLQDDAEPGHGHGASNWREEWCAE